jgi:uncharacterized membrane protein YphA (DoxX/SURF4 family)
MKIAILIGRVLLGVGFIIFGLNILHPFMTSPPPPEGSLAAQFVTVMVPSHWIGLVGVLQLLGGLLVAIGRTAPLGLVLLGPILVNILAFSYTKRSRNCTRFSFFRIGDLSYLRLP